jgi:hypothetical protein
LRDGLMAGEHIWYDLDVFCGQAGVDPEALRRAAGELAAAVGG